MSTNYLRKCLQRTLSTMLFRTLWMSTFPLDKQSSRELKHGATLMLSSMISKRTKTRISVRKQWLDSRSRTHMYVPISVSVGDTLEHEPTHICEADPTELIRKFMEESEPQGADSN